MADILPPAPIGSQFGSYAWADWYQKVRTVINDGGTVTWSSISGKPTTISGFGIVDGVTISGTQTLNNKSFSTIAMGSAAGTTLSLTGAITTGSTTLHKTSVALSNNAGAAVGTIANAPTAGNPTKWIAIDDNGTIRYIPTWT